MALPCGAYEIKQKTNKIERQLAQQNEEQEAIVLSAIDSRLQTINPLNQQL